MDIAEAEAVLEERLGQLPTRTVDALLSAMIDFYRDVRFDTAPFAADGDGLLLQWGTYDGGQGRHFELDLTRQFVLPGEAEPFQLSMTMRFEPTPALLALVASNHWCFSLEGLDEFEESMRSSPPFLALHASEPSACDVSFQQV